ncbi:flagellar export chaperone FlgN [Shewanella surugensis]|uniref:flagellar export chaperone FlgN n=1 Tax=Shewanella surugensis TaxID=212020 RepID=UPI004067CC40
MESLASLVTSQHQMLLQLQAILTQEKQAISDRNADLLLSLCAEKSAILTSIKTQDELIAHDPHKHLLITGSGLVAQLNQTQALLQQCKQLNAENASIVAFNQASLNRFSQALQASRNASSLTYNDKGKTSSLSSLGNNITV